MKLNSDFFARPARKVAHDLIGRTLWHHKKGMRFELLITEVSAHEDANPSASRKGMLYAPEMVFVMSFRGRALFNIATDSKNFASCVCIRAGVGKSKKGVRVLDGPTKVAEYLEIGMESDGENLRHEFEITGEELNPLLIREVESGSIAKNCVSGFRLNSELKF